MATSSSKDLYVLVADTHMRRTVEALLNHRCQAIGIRQPNFDIAHHPRRDPGCRTEAVDILRKYQHNYLRAMVLFDYEGCGSGDVTAIDLETQLENELATSGWSVGSVAVIVIYPELEAWLFGGSFQRLQQTIDWTGSVPLQDWFVQEGFLDKGYAKPTSPQVALDALLSVARVARSSNLFEQVAMRQSLVRCQDRAFQKFRHTLQRWFPVQ